MSGKHDIAWAAGFFEGEGHVKLTNRKKDGALALHEEFLSERESAKNTCC